MSNIRQSTTESLEQFLARGGKITKCPATEDHKQKADSVKSTTSRVDGPKPMSLEDYGLIYGDPKKPKKRTASSKRTVDMSALPDFLKKKYLKEVDHGGEEDEEGEEE